MRGQLTPGTYSLPGNVSSQFFTGLLFALSLLDAPSTVRSTTPLESADYVAMTIEAMARSGVQVEKEDERTFTVTPAPYRPFSATVEGDWSQAAFWYAANVLGSDLDIKGLNSSSIQGDMVIADHFRRLIRPGDAEIDVSGCPDLVPPLAAMAAVRQGTTRLINAARLRMKESDRLMTVNLTMSALGASVEEGADSLTIHGVERLTGGVTVDCCNDHRIAMMAGVAATKCKEPVILQGAQCVQKSYPNFWEHYQMLGGELDVLVSG